MKKRIMFRYYALKFFLQGKVSFFDFYQALLPYSWRSIKEKRRVIKKLFGNQFIVPDGGDFGFASLKQEIVDSNQYHAELIKDGAIVIDAGANLGMFSVFVASKYAGATIYAFEPTPATLEALKENARYYSNIKVFGSALGEKDGMSSFVITSDPGQNHIGEGGTPIQMKTIDSLSFSVDFIKIDTEGYEANVLKGAAETIKRCKPIIAMSAYHKPEDKTELPRVLNEIAPYDCKLYCDCEEVFICKPL